MENDLIRKYLIEPSEDILTTILQSDLEETELIDFKENISEYDKLGKSILGFSNTNGGLIITGIKQNQDNTFTKICVTSFIDKQVIFSKIRKYLPPQIAYSVSNYDIDSLKYQVVRIADMPVFKPYICMADGSNIRKGAIYIRKGTETLESDYYTLQEIINTRIESSFSNRQEIELEHHLLELKLLYTYCYSLDTMFSYENCPGNPDDYYVFLEEDGREFMAVQ